MNYIAYKYSNLKDKNSLISNLNKISDFLKELNQETYILGRDYANWEIHKLGSLNSLPLMFKHIKRSDNIIFYINSKVFSKGLITEFIFSKLLGKNCIFVYHDAPVNENLKFFGNIIAIDSIEQVREIKDFIK